MSCWFVERKIEKNENVYWYAARLWEEEKPDMNK
jgi:hypothetical protein